MTTLAATAKIMVATDIIGDAARVKGILSTEFKHVVTSADPDKAASDFMQHRPDVLVLAFNKLEKSERYYLGLLQLCPKTHRHPYCTVLLCYKEELKRAAELCLQVGFDDHILFWPMAFDDPNLIMSVHNALRELSPSDLPGGRRSNAQLSCRVWEDRSGIRSCKRCRVGNLLRRQVVPHHGANTAARLCWWWMTMRSSTN